MVEGPGTQTELHLLSERYAHKPCKLLYLAQLLRTPFSTVVLSEWTTIFLPRSFSPKVEGPKAIDSSSKEAIWLSPRRLNCSIVWVCGSMSAYSQQPSIKSTAATLGGVLRASHSSCTGFKRVSRQHLFSQIPFCSTSSHQLRALASSSPTSLEDLRIWAKMGQSMALPSLRKMCCDAQLSLPAKLEASPPLSCLPLSACLIKSIHFSILSASA